MPKSKTLGICVALALISAAHANVSLGTFTTGTAGSGNAASATFEDAGAGVLQITLSATGGTALNESNVLTALFFNFSGATLSATGGSVTVPNTSQIYFGSTGTGPNSCLSAGNCNGPNVSSEFAFKSGLDVNGASYGVSNSGLGLFGSSDVFPNSTGNLQGPADPAGGQYGIIHGAPSGNLDAAKGAKISDTVIIRLTGLPGGGSFGISDVQFNFNTVLDAVTATPEPSFFGVLAAAMAGLIWFVRRRRPITPAEPAAR